MTGKGTNGLTRRLHIDLLRVSSAY
ncbi:putative leader peptide [Streptomyces sp. NPDC048448]|uniref:Leader peptide n=1 Tax=Streptomyces kaempferi TaxID=333725 RepID=A0ABW3XNL2_9ACTN